jgi:hypothetical protein
MIATKSEAETKELFVIHPLFDVEEQKCDPSKLGRIEMSKSVKVSLTLLRVYLIAMMLMLCYHLLALAGVFGAHLAK